MPEPVSRYHVPDILCTLILNKFHRLFSFASVPDSSPLETNSDFVSAIFLRAFNILSVVSMFAGLDLGPTKTKSLYIRLYL